MPSTKPIINNQKQCTKCLEFLDLDQFKPHAKSAGGLNPRCIPCNMAISKEYYQKNKQDILPKEQVARNQRKLRNRTNILAYLKEHPCLDCGESDPVVLQFDHRDPGTKEYNVSYLVGKGYRWETVELELNKCDVRCANCHARKTANDLGFYDGHPDYYGFQNS